MTTLKFKCTSNGEWIEFERKEIVKSEKLKDALYNGYHIWIDRFEEDDDGNEIFTFYIDKRK